MRLSKLCAPALGAGLILASVAAHANSAAPTTQAGAAAAPAVNELKVVGTKDAQATSDGAPDIDKVVCKVQADTGSRIKTTKHCMSQRQASAAGRSAAKKIDENATVVSFTD